MIERLIRFQRTLATAAGRRLLAGRAFVVALALALLVIPSTCAQMAGPHSTFTNPVSGGHAAHHHAGPESGPGFSSTEELTRHVLNGNGSPGWVLSEVVEDEDCPTTPRLRDLPSTMTMSAVNAPLTLDCAITLELPTEDEPAVADAPALHAISLQVESPPPR